MYTIYFVTFNEWINTKYLDWQKVRGKRQSLKKFAEYLGVPPASLSDWMNGRYPPRSAENIGTLAEKLGMEVYELLGFPQPDPDRFDFEVRLRSALREAMRIMLDGRIDPYSEEGEKIITEIAAKFGVTANRADEE